MYIYIYFQLFGFLWFSYDFMLSDIVNPMIFPFNFPSENHPTGGQFGGALHRLWSPCCTTTGDLAQSHAQQSEHFCGFGHEDFRWDSG